MRCVAHSMLGLTTTDLSIIITHNLSSIHVLPPPTYDLLLHIIYLVIVVRQVLVVMMASTPWTVELPVTHQGYLQYCLCWSQPKAFSKINVRTPVFCAGCPSGQWYWLPIRKVVLVTCQDSGAGHLSGQWYWLPIRTVVLVTHQDSGTGYPSGQWYWSPIITVVLITHQ